MCTILSKLYGHIRQFVARNRLRVSTTTGFFRNDRQMETILCLFPRPKTIYFFGCSDGCEPYAFAIHLKLSDPSVEPDILGFDINEGCIAKARAAVYANNQLDYYRTGTALTGPKAQFFRRANGNKFQLDAQIARVCKFKLGSVLDEEFISKLPPADLVFCQNVLDHLSPKQNRIALRNLRGLLTTHSLLVIGGMRPELRSALTQELRLDPVTNNCRAIHDGWRDVRGWWDQSKPWARAYYFLEPFREAPDWPYRYSSIFRLPSANEKGQASYSRGFESGQTTSRGALRAQVKALFSVNRLIAHCRTRPADLSAGS